MGQLEKYGLYVLCLVIFLILGVTIWGDGAVPAARRAPAASGLNASAGTVPVGRDAATRTPGNAGPAVPNLQALLQPAIRPVATPPRDGGPADTGGTLNAGGGSSTKPPAAKEAGKSAGATPSVETPPAPVARPTYKVESGDSFDSIAKEKLGSSTLRTEIARLNPGVDPKRMQVGHVLTLPSAADLASSSSSASSSSGGRLAADASASREAVVAYTIGKGDTLEGIARRQLGDHRRVGELQELNPGVEPKNLRIGQKIRLPRK